MVGLLLRVTHADHSDDERPVPAQAVAHLPCTSAMAVVTSSGYRRFATPLMYRQRSQRNIWSKECKILRRSPARSSASWPFLTSSESASNWRAGFHPQSVQPSFFLFYRRFSTPVFRAGPALGRGFPANSLPAGRLRGVVYAAPLQRDICHYVLARSRRCQPVVPRYFPGKVTLNKKKRRAGVPACLSACCKALIQR